VPDNRAESLDRADSALFVTFEGPEGGGKSTQLLLLQERLQSRGLRVVVTREPGGTPTGESIRRMLLDQGPVELDPPTEAFLFMAARTELVNRVIRPSLLEGEVVLCDRFADATRAYQGYGSGIDLALLDDMIHLATGGLVPDVTILLDLPVRVGLERRATADGEWTKFDAAEEEFHARVREGYLRLAAESSDRWSVIDAERKPDAVAKDVWRAVSARLPQLPSASAGGRP
jgi:dTMP kinase